MLRILITVLLVLNGASAAAAAYKVGLAETGYVPFSFPKDDLRVGIFMEVLQAVGKLTGDTFEPVFAPTVRLKALFEQGKIDIECGISPEWRKDQEAISAYSHSFTTVDDVILYRQGEKPAESPLKGPKILKKGGRAKAKKVGTVRGYYYPKLEDAFKGGALVRENADNEGQLVQMLQRHRVDFMLIGLVVARYYMKLNPHHDFAIGEVIGSVPVMFRVLKSKSELLKRFDPALDRLSKSGELDRIFSKQE